MIELPDNIDARILLEFEADIHYCLNRRANVLKFIPKLETYFEKTDTPKRRKRYFWSGLCGLTLYLLFCLNDQVMLPDIYLTAWIIRLAFVSPIMALCLYALHKNHFSDYFEWISGFLLVLVSSSILLLLGLSEHPNVIHYHTGILLIVVFGNIIVRLKFKSCIITSLIIMASFILAVPLFTNMSQPVIINSSVVLFSVILVSLAGCYQIELELRRAFLLGLLQQINTLKLKKSNQELTRLSISDGLTGLANRRFFDDAYKREWNGGVRYGTRLSMIFIDIDFFKNYNDTYGHPAGDICLQKIGAMLTQIVRRGGDIIARYGGEEFVILLPDTPKPDAKQLAENIRKTVENRQIEHKASKVSEWVTISLGVASLVPDIETEAQQLIDMADKALYQAKEQGRNRVCDS